MWAIGRVSLIAYITASCALGKGFGGVFSLARSGSVSGCDLGRAEVLRERAIVVGQEVVAQLAEMPLFEGHESSFGLHGGYCETVRFSIGNGT